MTESVSDSLMLLALSEQGALSAWTFNTGDYGSGNYNILVEAVRKEDRQSYSYSFNLKIAR